MKILNSCVGAFSGEYYNFITRPVQQCISLSGHHMMAYRCIMNPNGLAGWLADKLVSRLFMKINDMVLLA